jgi:hypothetical protein
VLSYLITNAPAFDVYLQGNALIFNSIPTAIGTGQFADNYDEQGQSLLNCLNQNLLNSRTKGH